MFKKWIAQLLVLVMVFGLVIVQPWDAKAAVEDSFEAGAGTVDDPYQIKTVTQLVYMNDHIADHPTVAFYYKLVDDIALDSEWDPISSYSSPFIGTFDGNGHKISNLFINRPNDNYQGLFGSIGEDSEVKNVTLTNVNVTGYSNVGALAGYNAGTITNLTSNGDITAGDLYSYAPNEIGGLVGKNYGTIANSFASGSITTYGYYSEYIGGLVGYNLGTIIDSEADVDITTNSSYSYDIGGLVGQDGLGTITNSKAHGDILVTNQGYSIGGLLGESYEGTTITNSEANGNVTGTESVGGLVGYYEDSTITNSVANGTVTGVRVVGGLVGNSDESSITNSHTYGDVSSSGAYTYSTGGLVGTNYYGIINNSTASGDVSAAGGIGGYDGNYDIGGLVGYNNYGAITSSQANGDVIISSSEYVGSIGGLVGYDSYSTITYSQANGNIINTSDYSYNVGGLTGYTYESTINNSLANGNVTGNDYVGGLIGYGEYSLINNSYAIGAVVGVSNVDGFIGDIDATTITSSYYDVETAGIEDDGSASNGEGKSTAEMKTQSTFVDWDFDEQWIMQEEITYPLLRNFTATVSFESNGGNTIDSVMVSKGSKITAPVVTRSGYTFRGWFTDSELTIAFNDVTDLITEDITLYAKWQKKSSTEIPVAPVAPSTTTMEISTTDGGEVNLNGIIVNIPASAMDGSFKVTIAKVDTINEEWQPNDGMIASDIYEFTKDKSGNFSKSVTITLPFDKSKVDLDKLKVTISWLNEETNEWIELDNIVVNWIDGTVSGDVDHFTKFAVIAEEKQSEAEQPAQPIQEEQPTFTDIAGHWAEKYILTLTSKGAISGYLDGSFKPNNNITRAEFATVLVHALGLEGASASGFSDTANHWGKNAIAIAKANGIISGFEDGTFKPNAFITREQMALMVVNAFKLEARSIDLTFADQADISQWANTAIQTAVAHEIMSGFDNNTLKPLANATRAEAVRVIVNALDK